MSTVESQAGQSINSIQCFRWLNSLRELSRPFGHALMGGMHKAASVFAFVYKKLKAQSTSSMKLDCFYIFWEGYVYKRPITYPTQFS